MCKICDETGVPPHYGKAAVAMLGDKMSMTVECVSCGRIQLPDIDIHHIRTIAQLLDQAADHMGLPPRAGSETVFETVSHESGDPSVIEKGMQAFEKLSMRPPDEMLRRNGWPVDQKEDVPSWDSALKSVWERGKKT